MDKKNNNIFDENNDNLFDSNSDLKNNSENTSNNQSDSNFDENLMSYSDSSSFDSNKKNPHISVDSHFLENKNSKTHSEPEFIDQKNNKSKIDKGLKIFLIISTVVFGTLFLIFGASIFAKFLKNNTNINSFIPNSNNQNNSAYIHTQDIPEDENAKTAEQIYQEISPSIVGVIAYNPSVNLIYSATGQGSGIIISEDGYIVTNSHVIGNSNKYRISVVTSDKKEYPAKIVGFDTKTDIAVLKIDASNLKAAVFGNSDQLAVGATVLAIGNPGGLEFYNTLTRGVISALNRSLDSVNGDIADTSVKYIQTDAAINPGNSGGALLNMYGQVIGMPRAKLSNYEGFGFSIPCNTVKTVVDDIIKNGYVSGRVKIGISVRPLSVYEAQINNVPQGLIVISITEDSPAKNNGLRIGDIITKISDTDIKTTAALYKELSKYKPGDSVDVTVYRLSSIGNNDESYLNLKITLIEDKGDSQ